MQGKLIGVRLGKDFVIESARVPTHQATGSCQSTGYIVRASDGRRAFVKMLDTTVDRDAFDPIGDLKASYRYLLLRARPVG